VEGAEGAFRNDAHKIFLGAGRALGGGRFGRDVGLVRVQRIRHLGKPIVATNRGGIPYVVQDKVNGYLCDYGDINTFSKKIYEIISDVELRNKFSRKSKELSKVYDWGYICKNIFEVYKEIYNKL
jgi:glycosyltransferase involved in cell wall biosynthesis